jgi:hypothetical protein
MTPKEKAKELKDKFQKQIFFHVTDERLDINEAKGLALIAVDEILNALDSETIIYGSNYCFEENKYWQQVKENIEKL